MIYKSRFSLIGIAAFATLVGCKEASKATTSEVVSADKRTAVTLPADAQQAVLLEMRQMLGAIGGAMSAAVRNDSAGLQAALAPARSAAAADPAIEAMLPREWKELAERTHGGFDSLAIAAQRTHDASARKDTVLMQLARISGSCSSCHETFRVAVQ